MARPLSNVPDTHQSGRWSFTYNDGQLDCPLLCMQCEADVQQGGAVRQCRRNTCYSLPFCWQHLKSRAHLRIGRTRIRDPATGNRFRFKGLFACVPHHPHNHVAFMPGQVIVTYMGEILSEDQFDARYPDDDETAPYANRLPGGEVTDAACMRGVAALANHVLPDSSCAGGDRCVTNVELVTAPDEYAVLRALVPIYNGDEIFVDYGDEYWGGTHADHQTRPARVYNRIEYKCR